MTRALLDTSFVIALGRNEDISLNDAPEEAAISIVTLCGLHHGVLIANDTQRPGRLALLSYIERRFSVLPLDERIAPHYGRIVSETRRKKKRKLKLADALIAATAAAHDITLFTRDSDFKFVDGVDIVVV